MKHNCISTILLVLLVFFGLPIAIVVYDSSAENAIKAQMSGLDILAIHLLTETGSVPISDVQSLVKTDISTSWSLLNSCTADELNQNLAFAPCDIRPGLVELIDDNTARGVMTPAQRKNFIREIRYISKAFYADYAREHHSYEDQERSRLRSAEQVLNER